MDLCKCLQLSAQQCLHFHCNTNYHAFFPEGRWSCYNVPVLQSKALSHHIIQPLQNSGVGKKCQYAVLLVSITIYIYRENINWKQRKTEQKWDLLCLCPISRCEKGTIDFSLRRSHSYNIAIIMTTIKIDFLAKKRESSANKNIR